MMPVATQKLLFGSRLTPQSQNGSSTIVSPLSATRIAAIGRRKYRGSDLEHDQEKWTPVFLKNRAKTNESRA
jgi:hypothetical protein